MPRRKQIAKRIATTCLVLSLLIILIVQLGLTGSGNERYFSGSAEDYCQALIRLGFPADYATALTELHLLHPDWSFVPLEITETKSTYTWNYVIEQETKDPSNNLISSSDTYIAYRHPTNTETYDAGHYQASVAAVEYFMDPRNFLNEADIFLFFELTSGTDIGANAVSAVLKGTFMENAKLENGMTYTDYFCKLGKEIGINPVYLAAKVRQEQGVAGTSHAISGKCGSKLWEFYSNQTEYTTSGSPVRPPSDGESRSELENLNGYYNFYNVNASGNGVFSIYKNAMLRAVKGTESKKSDWGGSPSWNTKWKSLYGGAYFLKQSYIDRYQSTVYLQKFNVDSRSDRNFWGQYMQSVSGGLGEARSLFQSFASIDALDHSYTFLIPVYKGMPEQPAPDPAGGTCASLAPATARYSYRTELTFPSLQNANSNAIYTEEQVFAGGKLNIKGYMSHSYGTKELQYAWDGGEWKTATVGEHLNFSLPIDFSENSSHILVIRGKANYNHNNSGQKSNAYFLGAVIYVTVTPPPSVNVTYQVGNQPIVHTLSAGSSLTLPANDTETFAGWIGSDGSFLPSGAEQTILEDITFTAVFLDFRQLSGAALNTRPNGTDLRFSAVLDDASYQKLLPFLTLSADVTQAEQKTIPSKVETKTLLDAGSKHWIRLDVATPLITQSLYKTDFSADFYANLHYTNGEQKQIHARGESTPRNAAEVACEALEDLKVSYSPEARTQLQIIAGVK